MYQKNGFVRLYVYNTHTGHVTYIPLEMETDEARRKWLGEGEQWSWSSLSTVLNNNQMELRVWRKEPLPPAVFNINIVDGESLRQ